MLTRIRYPTDKQAGATGHMLDRVKKWMVHFHFDRLGFLNTRRGRHHCHRSSCRRFRSFFVNRDKRLMKHLRDREVIVLPLWRDPVEIGAAGRLVEGAFYPER